MQEIIDGIHEMETSGVSVVIATCGRPQLLRRAIRSINAQVIDIPIEVIVVFDGIAIDHLTDVARKPGLEIKTKLNERSKGLAGGRNTGILAASHELVAFCDDDDEWTPEKLGRQMQVRSVDSSALIIATGILIASPGGKHKRRSPIRTELPELLRSRITELHPSSFLIEKAALLGTLGLVDEAIPGSYAEDYDLLLRAAKIGHIAAAPEPLTIVHWDRASFFTEKWAGITKGLEYLLKKHPEFRAAPKGNARIHGQIAFAYAAQKQNSAAAAWAKTALKQDKFQPRAFLAYCISARLLPAAFVVRTLNRLGKGL